MRDADLHRQGSSDPRTRLPSLQILESELDEFGRTGHCLHLLHAARALDDARAELRRLLLIEANKGEALSCGPEQFDER